MLVNRCRQDVPRRTYLSGFTLIELMTVVSVLAVLVALALPSFHEFVSKQRVRNASFQLVAGLARARSQAITQSGTVSLQKSGAKWNAGWTVTDGTRTFASQESLTSLNILDSGSVSAITYGRDGRLTSGATKFTIKPVDAANDAHTRCISIDLSGISASIQGACS